MDKIDNQQKRRRLALLLIVLFIFVAVTSCIVGYILCQRTTPESGGQVIDTIVLSPTDSTPAVPLSMSGLVHYADGTPCAGKTLELHSEPRVTVTDSKGRFFFYDVEKGDHTIKVVDADGQDIATVSFLLDENQGSGAELIMDGDHYTLSISVDVLLLEIDIELDQAGGFTISDENLCAVRTGGRVITSEGTVSAADTRFILTPQGSSVFSDGSVHIPYDGVILNDGTYIAPDGVVILPDNAGVIAPDGTFIIGDGMQIVPGGGVTLPDGTQLSPGQTENLPPGVTAADDGTLTLADGMTLSPNGAITLPGSTTIAPDGGVTLPNGAAVSSDHTAVTLTDGTEISLVDKEAALPDGTTVGDNTVTLPDGTIIDNENNTVTTPGGTVVDADGNVTLPDGTMMDPGAPGAWPDGTTVDGDGTVTLPDGATVRPDGTVTSPGGEQITPPTGADGYVVGEGEAEPIGGAKPATGPNVPAPADTPDVSDTPGIPDAPDTPDPLDTPDTPDPPDTPDAPDAPDAPDVPDTPDTPDTPSTPPSGGGSSGGGGSGPPSALIDVKEGGTGGNNWTQLSTINLYAVNDSAVTDKIYPGVSGSYAFNISNVQAYGVRFSMTISETGQGADAPPPIPFEYRLKTAGGYVAGTADIWLTAAQLDDEFVTLAANSSMGYTLEWRWPYEAGHDALDTGIGSHRSLTHTVTVAIHAEQVV